jgi:DNA-binding SARP family transcriptional activator/tetratricopeptide (TPR) repeat protein
MADRSALHMSAKMLGPPWENVTVQVTLVTLSQHRRGRGPEMVEFRLLGALEIRVGTQPVPLGHQRQQCVLATLLIEANQPVSADQLLHRVWGDDLPQRVRGTLYSYISRLRRALSPHGIPVERRSSGYVLRVDPTAVDMHRFRHAVGRAKEAADDRSALALLDEAVGLWRGEPLAGLSSPWLDTMRDHLEAERWAVELDRTDVMLRTGRHSECLAELSARTAAHPLDERLAGQLLLALYRCGRPADALDYYQRTRRLLAEELGTDPGPALRALHQRILSGDRTLELPTATGTSLSGPGAGGAARPSPLPRQLPASPDQFIGRECELNRLDEALKQHAAPGGTALLGGIGGLGKTWLALRWAHDNLECFPDGQLYLNLRGFEPNQEPLPPRTAVRSFLDALGAARDSVPDDFEAQVGLYRSLVAGRRILMVLDNARDAEQVRPLLPGSAGCTVIVTSRDQMPELVTTEGARPITPGTLTREEAYDLLSCRLGKHRMLAEPDAVDDIITAGAGLPLALAIVAARAATHPTFSLSMLADELRQSHGGLDAFTCGESTLGLRSVFSCSYQALSTEAATLFRLLGRHPGPEISRPAAVSLAGLAPGRTRTALAELVRAQLITEHRPGRYVMHDLLRAYATELADDTPHRAEQQAALLRTISHYTNTAYHAVALIEPHRTDISLAPVQHGALPETLADARAALSWLTTERPVLLALFDHLDRAGLDLHTWQMAWTLSSFHANQGHLREWLTTQTTGLRAAERLGDLLGQALSHRALARIRTRLGHHGDAESHGTRALALFAELGDATGQARTHLGLGWLLDQQSRHKEALDHVEQALVLFRSVGNTAGEARALNACGWSRTLLGDFQQAVSQCRQALALLKDIQDRTGEAATWDTLGHAYHRFGEHAEAAECYGQAIELYRELGDRHWEAETLTRLGDTYESVGNGPAAMHAWRQALILLDTVGHPKAGQLRKKLAALTSSGT